MKKTLITLLLAITAMAAHSHALTYLGFASENDPNGDFVSNGGNDHLPEVKNYIEFLGYDTTDLALLGKSDGSEPAGFLPTLNSLHGGTSGTINYTGLANIMYLTFKGGNTKGTTGKGYHLYKFMNGSFDLLVDNPNVNATNISHISVWTTKKVEVPDSGTTFALLGAALLGLIAFRSRKS